ncbi:MAG TPA: RNA polymerase sigma factor [Nannocystaceae bacterium]|nr:RNA polymerase sigma factor [Nannocystaceae bacterium]
MIRAKATNTVLQFPGGAPADADETERVDIDAELVERARRDDMTAWALLYRSHHGSVFRHVLGLVGTATAAEDITQETFARALVSLRGFTGRSTFATWLHGIALNLVRSDWRSKERAVRAQDQLSLIQATQELAGGELDRQLARTRRTAVLYGLLEKLSIPLREAFVLRYVRGLSASEAGAILGIEPGAVRVRAHRARELMETELARLRMDVVHAEDVP